MLLHSSPIIGLTILSKCPIYNSIACLYQHGHALIPCSLLYWLQLILDYRPIELSIVSIKINANLPILVINLNTLISITTTNIIICVKNIIIKKAIFMVMWQLISEWKFFRISRLLPWRMENHWEKKHKSNRN